MNVPTITVGITFMGRRIERTTRGMLAPESRAASISLFGTPFRPELIISTPNGTFTQISARTTHHQRVTERREAVPPDVIRETSS